MYTNIFVFILFLPDISFMFTNWPLRFLYEGTEVGHIGRHIEKCRPMASESYFA